jgi:hypothetical protein
LSSLQTPPALPPIPPPEPTIKSTLSRLESTPISLPVLLLCLFVTFLLSVVFALVVALVFVLRSGGGVSPKPDSDYDAAFESVGQEYAASLPEACGSAWVAGARDLDRGSTVSASLLHVAKLWDEARKASFNELVAPKLA